MVELREHQQEAVDSLDNGRILYGGVGAGKSLTALAYYMKKEAPKDVYVITTAKKRDSLEWHGEAAKYGIGEAGATVAGVLCVDSWHNIARYESVRDAFFIFDEQRLSGHGAWVKSFFKIAKANRWILLTATPGDTWIDYAPVFIANGWYKNFHDFKLRHVVYRPYVKFPSILRYVATDRLETLRNEILVEMPYMSHATRMENWLDMGYDRAWWDVITKNRWNPWTDQPIRDASEFFRLMRRLVNSDPSRLEMVKNLMRCHPKLVVFYNFDYELELLRTLSEHGNVAEWNGHNHEPIPTTDNWVYLVQYQSGSEGWNCSETDAMVLYSLTYSYKNFRQSLGRIDRMDSPFEILYYYFLVSDALIDRKIREALAEKRDFNEKTWQLRQDEWQFDE